MIDIHCHILPDIDDGPADLAGALAMARLAVADGIQTMVATPHVNQVVLAPALISQRVALFNQQLDSAGIALEVLVGADNGYQLGAETLANYVINGSQYLLIEFPHSHLPADARDAILDCLSQGLQPIITHPERNPALVRQPEDLIELVELGALVQVTGDSLTGGFGPEARSCARYLLKKGVVHFLASDGHSAQWRPPHLSPGRKAAAKIVGKDMARRLVLDHPQKVIQGENF